jgi:hypothetical protein
VHFICAYAGCNGCWHDQQSTLLHTEPCVHNVCLGLDCCGLWDLPHTLHVAALRVLLPMLVWLGINVSQWGCCSLQIKHRSPHASRYCEAAITAYQRWSAESGIQRGICVVAHAVKCCRTVHQLGHRPMSMVRYRSGVVVKPHPSGGTWHHVCLHWALHTRASVCHHGGAMTVP